VQEGHFRCLLERRLRLVVSGRRVNSSFLQFLNSHLALIQLLSGLLHFFVDQIHMDIPLYKFCIKFYYPLFKPFFEQGELFDFPTHSSERVEYLERAGERADVNDSFFSASRLTSSCTAFSWTSVRFVLFGFPGGIPSHFFLYPSSFPSLHQREERLGIHVGFLLWMVPASF